MKYSWKIHTVVLFIIAAACALFYVHLMSARTITAGADMTALFYPARQLFASSLRQGVIPLWNPYKFGGSPFLAAMQSGVCYPLNWLIAYTSPVVTGINFYIILHMILLAYFFHLLLTRAFSIPWQVAVVVSLLLPISGLAQAQVEHLAALAAITWIPLVLLGYFEFLHKGDTASLVMFIIALVMQIVSGHPQYVAYVGFFLFISGIYWLFAAGVPLRRSAARLALIGVGCAGALLVSAAQIIPALELSASSYRSLSGYEYAASFSMHPQFLLTLLNPALYRSSAGDTDMINAYPEFNLYLGIGPLLLLMISTIMLFKRQHADMLFLFCFSIFMVLFSFGSYTPLFRATLSIFPFLGRYRVPSRILILSNIIWLILVARLLCSYWNINQGKPLRILFLIVFSIICFVDIRYNSRKEGFRKTAPIISIEEQAGEDLRTLDRNDSEMYRLFRLMVKDDDYYLSPTQSGVEGQFRRLQPDINVLFDIPLVGGYEEGLLPSVRYKDFLLTYNRNLRNPSPDHLLLMLLNVRYVFSEPELPLISGRIKKVSWTPHWILWENLEWKGGAFWKEQVETFISLEDLDGSAYRGGALRTSFGTTFERGYMKKLAEDIPDDVSHALRLEQQTCNSFVLECERGTGDVLVSIPAFMGWVWRSDGGERRPLEPINAIMQTIPAVSAPERMIVSYHPFSVRLGFFLSLISLGCLIMIIILSYIMKKSVHPHG